MSIIYNGKTLSAVKYGSTTLDKVKYNGTTVFEKDPFKGITWSNSSWSDISKLLKAHYAGTINIADYWKVGDERVIPISSIASATVDGGCGSCSMESQASGNITFRIIGINHSSDTLATANGKRWVAAVTIQAKTQLPSAGKMNNQYDGSGSTCRVWSTSARRYWLNNNFKNALPTNLKSLIKPVIKKTYMFASLSRDRISDLDTTDSVFLLSNNEVYGGDTTYGFDRDYGTEYSDAGAQYSYYSRRSGKGYYNGGGAKKPYEWLRSGYLDTFNTSYFVLVDSEGFTRYNYPYNSFGILPAFCI